MNRRGFLGLLAGAGAASATSYFFAPVGGWKSDVIAQPYQPCFAHFNGGYFDGTWDVASPEFAAKWAEVHGGAKPRSVPYHYAISDSIRYAGIQRS